LNPAPALPWLASTVGPEPTTRRCPMTDAEGHPRGIRRRLGTTRRAAFPGDDWPEPSRAEPSRAEPKRTCRTPGSARTHEENDLGSAHQRVRDA
jgi:hypothetical protein